MFVTGGVAARRQPEKQVGKPAQECICRGEPVAQEGRKEATCFITCTCHRHPSAVISHIRIVQADMAVSRIRRSQVHVIVQLELKLVGRHDQGSIIVHGGIADYQDYGKYFQLYHGLV